MAIDFLQTYQRYKKEYAECRLPLVSPFRDIVGKYTYIVLRGDLDRRFEGIQAVLEFELQRIHWWEEIFGIPLHRKSLPRDRVNEQNLHEFLAQSLIHSIYEYRTGLRDTVSGLSSCFIGDIARGLYLACDWSSRGVAIVGPSNPASVGFSGEGDEYGQS